MGEGLSVLAIDVGTTRIKVGHVLASGTLASSRSYPSPDTWSELLDVVESAVRDAGQIPYSHLALTGRMAHAMLLDRKGREIAMSRPPRQPPGAALDPEGTLERRTGYGPDAPSLRSWWWEAQQSGTVDLGSVGAILPIKDWLLWRLGAEPGTDLASAASLGLRRTTEGEEGWDGPLLDRLGVDPSALPGIEAPGAPAGQLRPDLARGRRVILVRGSGDGVTGSLGVSDLERGASYINLGTHGVYRVAADRSLRRAQFSYPTGLGGVLCGVVIPDLGARLAQGIQDTGSWDARARDLLAPFVRWHHALERELGPGLPPPRLMGGAADTAVGRVLARELDRAVWLMPPEPTLIGAARLAKGMGLRPAAPGVVLAPG